MFEYKLSHTIMVEEKIMLNIKRRNTVIKSCNIGLPGTWFLFKEVLGRLNNKINDNYDNNDNQLMIIVNNNVIKR